MTTLLKPIDGNCAVCGTSDFILHEDHTEYSTCEWNAATQQFESTFSGSDPSCEEYAVRFFCASCGTGHQVPEELL